MRDLFFLLRVTGEFFVGLQPIHTEIHIQTLVCTDVLCVSLGKCVHDCACILAHAHVFVQESMNVCDWSACM